MKTDWKQLANQKATLLDLIDNGLLTGQQRDDLQGIAHFIDSEQDCAADRLDTGEVVFLHEDGYHDSDGKLVGPSEWTPGPNWRKIVSDVVDSEDDTGCDGVTVIDKTSFDKLNDAWSEVPND
jgi:hypothetical protein